MKIVRCDNFNRETVAEVLVAENISNAKEAEIMLNALIETCTTIGSIWYKLTPDDYRLWRGMEDII